MKTKKNLQYDDWLQQKLAKQREEKLRQEKRAADLETSKRKIEEKRRREHELRCQERSARMSLVKKRDETNPSELKGLKQFYSSDLLSPESNFNAWLKKKSSEKKVMEHKKIIEIKIKEEQLEYRKKAAQAAYDKWLQLKNLEIKHQKLMEKQQHLVEDRSQKSQRGFRSTRSEMSACPPMIDLFRKKGGSCEKLPIMECDEDYEPGNGAQTYRKSAQNTVSYRENKKSIAIINKSYRKQGLYNPPKKRFSCFSKKNVTSPPCSA